MTLSEQARADAQADAETLRRIALELTGEDVTFAPAYYATGRLYLLNDAVASCDGALAARAAFRAVPGLRP